MDFETADRISSTFGLYAGILAFLIPVVLGLLVFKLLSMGGVVITDKLAFTGLCIAPFLVVIWTFLMFWISCKVFVKQEI